MKFTKTLQMFLLVQLVFGKIPVKKGIELFNEGKFEAAKVFFLSVLDKEEENPEANYYLGRIMMNGRNFEDAADYLETAVELKDKDAEYHYWLGAALAEVVKEASVFRQPFIAGDIKEHFKRSVELDKNFLPGKVALAQFYIQAPSIVGGDLDKARELVKVIIKSDSLEAAGLYLSIYFAEEKWDSVDYVFRRMEKGIGDNQEMYGFYNSYGYYLLSKNRYEEAIRKFEKQVELAPELPNAYDSLGDGYKAAKKYEDAKKAYEKALKINPDFEPSKEKLKELKKIMKEKS